MELEHSLDEGTQWAVFEANDEPLWGASPRRSRICVVGVAPVRPAEFVIFRIGQSTGDQCP